MRTVAHAQLEVNSKLMREIFYERTAAIQSIKRSTSHAHYHGLCSQNFSIDYGKELFILRLLQEKKYRHFTYFSAISSLALTIGIISTWFEKNAHFRINETAKKSVRGQC
jgi:hypothetical protein